MLNRNDFEVWCSKLSLSETARSIISTVRTSQPSRNVGGGKRNVWGKYPSRKMAMTIQFESHRVELAAIYEMEHSDNVLEYYDQPGPIKLRYKTLNEKVIAPFHTPDFFVIRPDSAGWEEWKTEEELIELARKSPNRYVKDSKGSWRCPPGEEYAEIFGLYYRLRSSKEINWIYQRNILFLEDYFYTPESSIDTKVSEALYSITKEKPGITLSSLLESVEFSPDDIYQSLAQGLIYADLYRAPLVEPDNVQIFCDENTSKSFQIISLTQKGSILNSQALKVEPNGKLLWDGALFTIINLGESSIGLLNEEGTVTNIGRDTFESMVNSGLLTGVPVSKNDSVSMVKELITKASPEDLEIAHCRYEIISSIFSGEKYVDNSVTERTIRNWIRLFKKAEELYGVGYVGLLPHVKDRGNRHRKLPQTTIEAMKTFIEDDYESLKQKTKKIVYGALVNECEKKGVIPPSYKTFIEEINKRPRYQKVYKRQGSRAAYQHESFYWEIEMTTPRHGDRPFELCHIDHTELDIELIDSVTKKVLGRPWLTILTDAFSRRFLAIYLTFDPPSYRSCMMVLRECVHRFSRLPQNIVVDGGREFHSVYFDTLLARYSCVKKTRPAAKARFGSVCERLFGTTNTQFIHNLTGNTQITKNVRQVTKSVNPKNHAVWTLGMLYEAICSWAHDIYDVIEHPALALTPREAFDNGVTQSGKRPYKLIPFDEEFRIYTLPTTPRGTAKVLPGRGLKINYIFYWSDNFRDPEIENKQIPIRYDPYDLGIAYAYANNQWVKCISEHYKTFCGRSEKEIKVICAELKKRNSSNSKQNLISAKKLAEFIELCETTETLAKQQRCDAELKNVLTVIDGGKDADKNKCENHSPLEIIDEMSIDFTKLEEYDEF